MTSNARKLDENNKTLRRPTKLERISSRRRGQEYDPGTAHPSQERRDRYHREYETAETTLVGTIPTATDVEKFFLESASRKEVDEECPSTEVESIRCKINESVNENELKYAI